MKCLVISDIHVGEALESAGHMRAASHMAMPSLTNLFRYINIQHKPDIIVNLGDAIRSKSLQYDQSIYEETLQLFSLLDAPVIHLLGNHEIRQMSSKHLKKIWEKVQHQQAFYGSLIQNNHQFIWLSLEKQPQENGSPGYAIPENELKWLENTLEKVTHPTFIFTHCSLAKHDTSGNFFHNPNARMHFKLLYTKSNISLVFVIIQQHFILKAATAIP